MNIQCNLKDIKEFKGACKIGRWQPTINRGIED